MSQLSNLIKQVSSTKATVEKSHNSRSTKSTFSKANQTMMGPIKALLMATAPNRLVTFYQNLECGAIAA